MHLLAYDVDDKWWFALALLAWLPPGIMVLRRRDKAEKLDRELVSSPAMGQN